MTRQARTLLLVALSLSFLYGCAGTGRVREFSPGYPIGYAERGVASWYGPGFHGHKTANGERYDMYRMTAAHRTLPIGSVVSVRSLSNGRQTIVRINDRGPFAKGRIIDLSQAAAQSIGMIGTGTDRVELKVVGYEGRPGAFGFLRIQVGSFAEPENAQSLAGRLRGKYGEVRILTVDLPGGRRYRVQVGRFTTERQAQAVADQLDSQFGLESLVIRDDV